VKNFLVATALFGASLMTTNAIADQPFWLFPNSQDGPPITIAVFGDWPYAQLLLDNASLLTGSVNADADVGLVLHVGDIHSGSMACTSADILPAIATANPGWNQKIYYQFQQFTMPVVYTPGDNEWTDCHKSKQFSSGAPLKELASVRSLFFARAGHSLGLSDKSVLSQAQYFDPAHPGDAAYVENVMWMDGKVAFATLNMPGGSNNDTAPWSGIFSDPAAQTQEVATRTGADMRWLQSAFDVAQENHARAVVIALQADMWDPEAIAAGGAGLDQYTAFVQALADLTIDFGRPVLLLNGDTHVYHQDNPLADPASATGVIHHTQPVPNLTRIVVQGSTTAPAEWLRLTIDTRKSQPFTWTNVAYCKDPLTSCQ
jgi:hypothetical protein